MVIGVWGCDCGLKTRGREAKPGPAEDDGRDLPPHPGTALPNRLF